MVGQTLSHYRIESKLGAGGMGVVYKALDMHLDRSVALKVLPAEAVANPERKKRFVQEAKAASALNHPNIIHIYDIDTANGVDYIAMEYVAGRALDRLLGPRGLPLDEVLKYGVQVADALAKAHAAGIVHRDLKPANIMVTGDGLVKVLDFGLAKLAEAAGSGESEATETMRGPRTEEGVIVGTAAYMSPEQAQGKKVDARSDIFSFGVVLYEMLSGQRPFHGGTKMEILSAILQKEPKPFGEAVPGIPRDVERIVTLALRKDPDRRFQHMADVKVELLSLKEESESGRLSSIQSTVATPVPDARRWRRLVLGLAAGLVVVLAAAVAGWWRARPREGTRHVKLTRLTADRGLAAFPAVSPDGKLVAYASDRMEAGNLDIWVQQIEGGRPIRLTRHAAHDYAPAFSPDGARIVFRSDRDGGGIYMIPALGGDESLIAPRASVAQFSPDGKQIAYSIGNPLSSSEIYIVAVGPSGPAGPPRRLQPNFFSASVPLWTPDGKHVLFLGRQDKQDRLDALDWWVASIETSTPAVKTGASDALGRQGLSGSWWLLFIPGSWAPALQQVVCSARSGDSVNVWGIPISTKNWQVTGPPQRLTSGTGLELQPSVGTARDGENATTRLVFANLVLDNALWSLRIDANRGKALGEAQRITQGPASAIWPHLSADGKKLVFNTKRAGDWDAWMLDLESGKQTAVASSSAPEMWPKITADGSQVAYLNGQERAIYLIPSGGTVAQKVCVDCSEPWDWSWDKKKILYRWGEPRRILQVDLDSGQKTELLQHPRHGLTGATLSPDNRWIAFFMTISGRDQVLLAPYRNHTIPESEWVAVTDGSSSDYESRWSPDGNLLYFRSERDGHRCVWAQRLDPKSKRPVGSPFAVYHVHREILYPGSVADVVALGMAVARDKLVFAAGELTGDIWMAEMPGRE